MKKNRKYYDVVLVQPNIIWVYDSVEHLGLGYLAAMLRANGFKVKIIDAVLERMSMDDLYQELNNLKIGVLGLSIISHGYKNTIEFLEMYRRNHLETKVLTGGHFATFAYEKILNHTNVFDGIAIGEGEYTLLNYCKKFLRQEDVEIYDIASNDFELKKSFNRIISMDDLPFPARDYLDLAMSKGAIPSITSSRGCSAKCSFCTVHNFYNANNGPRWISRSIENIIEELTILHDKYKIKHFLFVDDNFIGPGPRGRQKAIDFANAYKKSKLPMTFHVDCRAANVNEDIFKVLVDSGLKSVFMGIESVSHTDLINYRKGLKAEVNWRAVKILKSFKLQFTLSMIMFNPLTDRQTILDNIRFLKDSEYFPRNPISVINFYEGTDANKIFKDYVFGPFWDYKFVFKNPIVDKIYKEALQFCKDTLPFERELSLRPDTAPHARLELARMRLLFLEDLTSNIEVEAVQIIKQRWRKRMTRFREIFNSKAPISSKMENFMEERLYLTGAQLDFSQDSIY